MKSKLTIFHGDYEKYVISPNPAKISDEGKHTYKVKQTIGKYVTTETLKNYGKVGVVNSICSSLDIPLINYHRYLHSIVDYSKDSEDLVEESMAKYKWHDYI
jgi:hypothetical protein